MMTRTRTQRSRGAAAVEFILCLPLLILLALPVTDLARVLQANTILTHMSREGANLAARTHNSEQAIMDALAATAPPLDMQNNGMIRITKILAVRGRGLPRNVVLAQHRWNGGTYAPEGGVWSCGSGGTYWDHTGRCAGLPSPSSAPTIDIMTGKLNDGEVVYLVETFYRFPLFFNALQSAGLGMPSLNPNLYAMTIF